MSARANDTLVADFIAEFLADRGVTHVYEMVGGMIARLVDSLHRDGRVAVISMHHEQGAAFAALAHGMVTRVPGVALATSGPGAINLLTGIGGCYFDSAPAVFITGQVNRNELKGDRPIRQLGFQETDIVAMAGPITKAAWRLHEAEEVPDAFARAFDLAVAGRPGPVLLDIPLDVQGTRIPQPSGSPTPPDDRAPIEHIAWDELNELVQNATRPLLLVGGGVRAAGASAAVRALAERLDMPVVGSLHAVDVLPAKHPLHVGMIGSYGNRWANHALGTADLLLVVGSRLDIRQTGSETQLFKGDRPIVHVDIDSAEINNRVNGCIPVVADARRFAEEALSQLEPAAPDAHAEWRNEIDELRRRWPDTEEVADVPGINPNAFMHELAAASHAAGAFVVDVGQHQMWAAQSLELGEHQRFLTSGGMGAMGCALPMAVGAANALAPAPVVVIAGDGGFQTNIQELQTVVRNRQALKLVVVNNGCHGMVRQFQESYFHGRYPSTVWGYSAPDFAAVAAGYGIRSATVDRAEQVGDALTELWNDPTEPFLLQVMVDTFANAYPKIAFGKPITEMEPFAKPVAMEGT